MSEMLERVAKAIEDAYGHQPCPALRLEAADAAMAAMREPTEAMKQAGYAQVGEHGNPEWVWQEMLDEARR